MTSSPEPALWALPDWSDDGADALGPAAPRPPARSGALAAVPAPAAWAPPEIAAAPAGAALVPDPRQARRGALARDPVGGRSLGRARELRGREPPPDRGWAHRRRAPHPVRAARICLRWSRTRGSATPST